MSPTSFKIFFFFAYYKDLWVIAIMYSGSSVFTYGLKIFFKCYFVADVCYVVKARMAVSVLNTCRLFLSLLLKQYSIKYLGRKTPNPISSSPWPQGTDIVLVLISNLEMIWTIREDTHRLYADISAPICLCDLWYCGGGSGSWN